MTEYTTRYLWNMTMYTSEQDAQTAAATFVSEFNTNFLSYCEIHIVEPDVKKYNALIINPVNKLTTHPKDLADDDPRYFNLSSVEDGDTYTGIRAVAVKRIHKEQYERYVSLRNLKQIVKTTFPARLVDNDNQALRDGEHSNQEMIGVTAQFNYG